MDVNIATTLPLADSWGMHGDDIGVGWWIVMMVGMVVFWGAVILGIVLLARGALTRSAEGRQETPLETLDRRFAEGAISSDDYQERRQIITAGARSHQGPGSEEEPGAPPR